MKASFLTLFPLFSLALSATSEPVKASTLVSQLSSAIIKLDTSVKAFKQDPATVKADIECLVSTIKECTSQIEGSADLDLPAAISLTGLVVSYTTAGQILIGDMKAQREAFESITLCKPIHKLMKEIKAATTKLTSAVCNLMPAAAQPLADSLNIELIDTLTNGTNYFNEINCQDDIQPSAPLMPTSLLTSFETIPPPQTTTSTGITTFPAIPPPTATATEQITTFSAIPPPTKRSNHNHVETSETTKTVVDTTDCEEETATPPPATISSAPVTTEIEATVTVTTECESDTPTLPPATVSTPVVYPSLSTLPTTYPTTLVHPSSSTPIPSYPVVPTITTSFTVPGNTTTPPGSTGVVPTSTYSTLIPTAAAAFNNAGSVGIFAGLAAALLL